MCVIMSWNYVRNRKNGSANCVRRGIQGLGSSLDWCVGGISSYNISKIKWFIVCSVRIFCLSLSSCIGRYNRLFYMFRRGRRI